MIINLKWQCSVFAINSLTPSTVPPSLQRYKALGASKFILPSVLIWPLCWGGMRGSAGGASGGLSNCTKRWWLGSWYLAPSIRAPTTQIPWTNGQPWKFQHSAIWWCAVNYVQRQLLLMRTNWLSISSIATRPGILTHTRSPNLPACLSLAYKLPNWDCSESLPKWMPRKNSRN